MKAGRRTKFRRTKAEEAMAYIYQQRIGAAWVSAVSGKTKSVINPATEEPLQEVPFGDGEDCKLAIEAAAAAFPSWSKKTAYERAAVLKRAADLMREQIADLAYVTTLESGKPLAQSRGEWGAGADLFEWYAEECKRAYGRVIPSRSPARQLVVLRQPLGVVGVITAWNFPIYNVARAGAAALAAGCTIVIRPSEHTPLTAMALVSILVEAGIPDGVVNLVNGQSSSIGQQLLDNPLCRKIHFTGSPRVGRLLMDGASKTVKRLSLELGGNAPVLVFADVDVERVAAGAVTAKFRNAGQVCIAPQRFIVHESIVAEFQQNGGRVCGQAQSRQWT
jgi:acyl-CoA reductase-like NAD-dependent aldehyde dehydrogenase